MSNPAGSDPGSNHAAAAWRLFGRDVAGAGGGALALLLALLLAFDPYGIVRSPQGRTPLLVDQSHRLMAPQVIRTGRYDAGVFGTSTIRLLDPKRLDAALGARFASLAMNAATPWEQRRAMDLFLREAPAPTTLLLGVDLPLWCAPDATGEAKRVTPRGFPDWLYDGRDPADLLRLLNLSSVEFALRLAAVRAGLARPRLREDGYDVFVPPDGAYDVVRARAHIARAVTSMRATDAPGSDVAAPAAPDRSFPALAWLEETFTQAAARGARVILTFMPTHVSVQPRVGGPDAARESACKARIAAIASSRSALVVDFRLASTVTREDANYWDPLHYRIGIAQRVVDALRAAATTGRDDEEGFYRLLASPSR